MQNNSNEVSTSGYLNSFAGDTIEEEINNIKEALNNKFRFLPFVKRFGQNIYDKPNKTIIKLLILEVVEETENSFDEVLKIFITEYPRFAEIVDNSTNMFEQ